MTTKTFHIGDILTVMTGRFVTPNGMDGIYALCDHMTGESLMTHQLPRASREAESSLREQFPDLAEIDVKGAVITDEASGLAWIAEQVARHGETREVRPLNSADHTSIDPIAELKMIRPNAPILAVEIEGGATWHE